MLLTIKNLRNSKVSISSLRISVPASGEKTKRFFDDIPEIGIEELKKLQAAGHISYSVSEDPDTPDEFEDSTKKEFDELSESLTSTGSEFTDLVVGAISAVQADISAVEQALGAAIEGDAVLSLLYGDLAEDVSAAELNAAAAGEFTKLFVASLKNAAGLVHGWANFTPTVTPGVTAADGDIGAPTVNQGGLGSTDAPKFSSGQLGVDVVFDTDAGATKTYQAGDTITVTVDVSALSLLSGVSNLVKTYNVVA